MNTIDDLKAVISKKKGLAKNNKFAVSFTPPNQNLVNIDRETVVGSLATGRNVGVKDFVYDGRDISILCDQVELPPRSISTLDYQSDRQSNKFPYTHIDGDVTMHFILTNDYYMKTLFDTWMSTVIDVDNYDIGYKDDYTADIVIQALDQENFPIYGVKLERAYPIDINMIALSNADEEFSRLTVSIAYDKYVVEGPVSSTKSRISSMVPNDVKSKLESIKDKLPSKVTGSNKKLIGGLGRKI